MSRERHMVGGATVLLYTLLSARVEAAQDGMRPELDAVHPDRAFRSLSRELPHPGSKGGASASRRGRGAQEQPLRPLQTREWEIGVVTSMSG